MTLTYIFHSGFVLETNKSILIFDYWLDLNGVVPPFLKKDKPIYVFSSHFHEDHFNKAIFEWRKQREGITYILSKDIYKHRRTNKEDADVWLAKGGTWSDSTLSVWALGSTDSGVSWIVETEGKRFFHAGDLNNWYARFLPEAVPGETIYSEEFDEEIDPIAHEKQYLGELKDIRKITDSFDVVMFPCVRCSGIEQSEKIVYLCCGAYCRTRRGASCFLFNSNYRAEACNTLNPRAFQNAYELAGVCGKSLHVPSLPFCINSVERQRRFSASA